MWAAAATLHSAARALDDPALRSAADTYDRAARPPYARIPAHTRRGNGLRAAARLLALAGHSADSLGTAYLIASLIDLAAAVAELRQAQQHAAQAAAARAAAEQLRKAYAAAASGLRSRAAPQSGAAQPGQARRASAPASVRRSFAVPPGPDQSEFAHTGLASRSSRPVPATSRPDSWFESGL